MVKKNYVLPILIIGLSIVFALISIGVYFTRGKSKFWISKKMLIGSFLLSLTAITNHSCTGTCYEDEDPSNIINLYGAEYSNRIVIDINQTTTITGCLYHRNDTDYSFMITDTLNIDTIQVGDVKPFDGEFNEYSEEIIIELDSTLPTNKYYLQLYKGKATNPDYSIASFILDLKNED
ncbi:MAG: hypothetical protein A2W99_14700 [Bacteroidetes bacterium GWF2_33_16]|nr:MAG: hypothetical protein A2X00_08910 [Bacteroidetes bacterium GWE2_32_14]OFY04921.1 MAG: hypothetical protein A2W99_14700 [Bacteroidetes bacterium GWF2_33_16]